MDIFFVRTTVPSTGNTAIRVASARDNVAVVVLGLWRFARRRRVGYHVHSHCFRYMGDYIQKISSRTGELYTMVEEAYQNIPCRPILP